MPIFLEAAKVNYAETAPALDCPIYFFVSNKDYVSNYLVVENYFNKLDASEKEIIWFEKSSHEIPSEEPRKFSEELIKVANQINK